MKSGRSLLLAGAALLVLAPKPAPAWIVWSCDGDLIQWLSDPHIRLSAVSFPPGAYRDAAVHVMRRWNRTPSAFHVDHTVDEPSVARGNRENEVWFSVDPNLLGGAPALTFHWDDCGDWFSGDNEILEKDVVFDANRAWSAGASKTALFSYGGSSRPFRTTAMHEFGHVAGLLDQNEEYSIMGQDWTHLHANGSTAMMYPGEDAADGAVELYGLGSTTREDVAVVHWRRTGANGLYSVHGRTRIFDSTCQQYVHPSFTDAGEPRYYVTPGQTICVEFTYENNGRTTQHDVDVGFYLSSNDYISALDTRLGGMTIATLGRGRVYTRRNAVTLPGYLVSGSDHYVGVIVDENDEIDESSGYSPMNAEYNNATYTGIRALVLDFDF